MARRIGALISALLLATASTASAEIVTGTVRQVDNGTGVIVFDDGRVVPMTANTVVLLDTRPPVLAAVEPGTRVVVVTENSAVGADGGRGWAPSAVPGRSIEAPDRERGIHRNIRLDEMIQTP